MKRREPKAGEWLRQQIEELGALRNASVRDTQFKAWRQNTLTYIQRIWEGDATKSERFRRIPFSPNSTRADARIIREQFERGCGEALEYLNSLLESLGEDRVAPGTTRSIPREPERIEGDFPLVELGAELGPAAPADAGADASGPAEADIFDGVIADAPILDLPPAPEVAEPPAPRSAGPSRLPDSAIRPVTPEGLPEDFAGATPLDPPAEPAADAPPPPAAGSRISVRSTPQAAPVSRESRPNPMKGILGPQRREGTPPARPARNGRKRKAAKPRLKDMLGLANLEAPKPAARPARPAASPAPAAPPAASVSPAPAPPAARPSPSPPAAVPESTSWTLPEFRTPAEPPLPLTEQDVQPADPALAALPDAGAGAGTAPPESGPAASLPEPAEAPEAAEEPDDDAVDTARVMEDFLLNSPVMRARPRPVQRRGAEATPAKAQPLPSRDSAASRMLAIAADVETLGVPENHRARVRAALMDLARQLDEPELSWDVLRDAVQFVMVYPAIARRALPLLLPFLDLAA